MSSNKDSYEDKYNKLVERHNMLDLERSLRSLTSKIDRLERSVSCDIKANVDYYEALVSKLRTDLNKYHSRGEQRLQSSRYNFAVCVAVVSFLFSLYLMFFNQV